VTLIREHAVQLSPPDGSEDLWRCVATLVRSLLLPLSLALWLQSILWWLPRNSALAANVLADDKVKAGVGLGHSVLTTRAQAVARQAEAGQNRARSEVAVPR
jgi:hypothetical protein